MGNKVEIYSLSGPKGSEKRETRGVFEFDQMPDGPFCFKGINGRVLILDLTKVSVRMRGEKIANVKFGEAWRSNIDVALGRQTANGVQTIAKDYRIGVLFERPEGVTKPQR